MKKNVATKIILAMLALALVFALASCSLFGGGDDNTDDTNQGAEQKALDTPVVTVSNGVAEWEAVSGAKEYFYTIYNEDGSTETGTATAKNRKVSLKEGQSIGVVAKPKDATKYKDSAESTKVSCGVSALSQLINVVNGASGLINILNGAKANDTLSADVSIGGYFTANAVKNNIALSLKANAGATLAEALISFALNDKEYVALGYADNKVLVYEPNEAFYINANALKTTVNAVMTKALGIVGNFNFDFDKIASIITETVDGFGEMIDLSSLLSFEKDEKTGAVTIGITCSTLNTVLGLGSTLKIDFDTYGGYLDKGIGILNDVLESAGKEKVDVSWASVVAKIKAQAKGDNGALLKLVVGTDKSGVINGLDVIIDLSALDKDVLNYQAGLTIAINSFTTASKVSIDTARYKSKDIKVDADVELPLKDVKATLKTVIRLSEAFADENQTFGTAILTATKGATTKEAKAYINGKGAYVDFTGIFDLLGVTGQTTQYKAEYNFGKSTAKTLAGFINEKAVKALTASNASNASFADIDVNEAIAAVKGGEAAIWNYVYNKVLPIVDSKVTAKTKATEADVVAWIAGYAQKYCKFKIETSFKTVLDNVKKCHESGKEVLKLAVSQKDNVAGVQLIGSGEVQGLVDYLEYFVNIPTIKNNEMDFENVAEDITAEVLNAWLSFVLSDKKIKNVFETDKPILKFVEEALGKSLENIINDGLYFEVTGDVSEDTSYAVKSSAEGKVTAANKGGDGATNYAIIGGGIGFVNAGSVEVSFTDVSNFTAFNAKGAGEDPNYVIQDAMVALLEAYLAAK